MKTNSPDLSFKMKATNHLKSVDLFKKPIALRLEGQDYIASPFGGILSIPIIIGMVCYAYFRISDVILMQNSRHFSSSQQRHMTFEDRYYLHNQTDL